MRNLQDLLKEVDAILDSADTLEPPDAIVTACEPPTDRLLDGLRTHFGYTSFRKGQREIIAAILAIPLSAKGNARLLQRFWMARMYSLCSQQDTESRCVTNCLP
jgi:hypothetical protein